MFQKGETVKIGIHQAKVIDCKASQGGGYVVLSQNKGEYAVHYYTEHGFSTGTYTKFLDEAKTEFAERR